MILGNPKESGADLAVALVNTWDTYDDPPEHLEGIEDLRLFLRLVGREQAAEVATDADLAEVKELRDRLRRVFETDEIREAAQVLNRVAAETGALPRLEGEGEIWEVRFGPDERSIVAHLGATAAAALIEIVRAHGLTRFGTCSAPPCTGAFVDRTKNRRKRYCCELCADREAQRRHRAR
ncbi:MAG TPA: CGNR zinc finger domain-containing protein [Gaiellaceae bacterium]|nr:CGNR zinc finger domain-containing protein [Gaiellaceae bacterium]